MPWVLVFEFCVLHSSPRGWGLGSKSNKPVIDLTRAKQAGLRSALIAVKQLEVHPSPTALLKGWQHARGEPPGAHLPRT